MTEVFANSEDPDQMLSFAASDLGLHCLSITLLGVSRIQRVNGDLKEEQKKTTSFTKLGTTTDSNSQVPTV